MVMKNITLHGEVQSLNDVVYMLVLGGVYLRPYTIFFLHNLLNLVANSLTIDMRSNIHKRISFENDT